MNEWKLKTQTRGKIGSYYIYFSVFVSSLVERSLDAMPSTIVDTQAESLELCALGFLLHGSFVVGTVGISAVRMLLLLVTKGLGQGVEHGRIK